MINHLHLSFCRNIILCLLHARNSQKLGIVSLLTVGNASDFPSGSVGEFKINPFSSVSLKNRIVQ